VLRLTVMVFALRKALEHSLERELAAALAPHASTGMCAEA
jgi:hypothetical protein